MQKNAALLTIMMLVSKFFGFIRESVLSYFYEAGTYTDAYFTANLVPTVFLGFIAGGLAATFMPIYSRIIHNEGEERANRFMNNIVNILFLGGLVVAVLGMFFTGPIVNMLGAKLDPETKAVARNFVRLALLTIIFNGSLTIFQGYHQYNERFFIVPIGGIIMNITLITLIVISSFTDPILLGIAIFLSTAIQFLYVFIMTKVKGNYKHRLGIDFNDHYIKPMFQMAVPIIMGASINQVNTLVDRQIASQFPKGSISILNYSSKISDSVYTLFAVTIVTVMYPELTKQASRKDFDALKESVNRIINTIILIVVPASVGMIVLRRPIIYLFHGRGKFSQNAQVMELTAKVMALYAVGSIGYGLRDAMTRTFYALHDSMTPVLSGILSVVINVGLSVFFSRRIGLSGIALATSIASISSAIILYYALYRKVEGFSIKPQIIVLIKVLFSSFIMGWLVYKLQSYLLVQEIHYLVNMGISIILGIVSYLILMYFMKIEEFNEIIALVRHKVKK